ncbi:lysophospholipid acyltransferase family protein [Desulfosarcina sp.]|uniref:lysophospholipid acyltransferase family protein n=1 Tax=Desulfosarcina sp. TaxID=2027861 RepID=UPI003970612F
MPGFFTKLIYIAAYLLGMIPRRFAFTLAKIFGAIWFTVDKTHRSVALGNLTTAFGGEKTPGERMRVARAAFHNLALIPFEIGWSLDMSMDDFMRHCTINGQAHLRNARAKGKGVLILTLHMGNWELLPISYRFQGFNVSMVYRPLDFKPADRFFLQYRCRFGANPIHKKKSMRKVLDALRRKDCVGILLDQDSGLTAGVFADFFGQPACTNKGMALMALKTGAPVVPTYLVRHGNRFEIHIEPEVPLIRTGDKERDIQENTRQYNQVMEAIIRRYPEQWLWVHRRWKNRPPD